jgi:hypothetical protein
VRQALEPCGSLPRCWGPFTTSSDEGRDVQCVVPPGSHTPPPPPTHATLETSTWDIMHNSSHIWCIYICRCLRDGSPFLNDGPALGTCGHHHHLKVEVQERPFNSGKSGCEGLSRSSRSSLCIASLASRLPGQATTMRHQEIAECNDYICTLSLCYKIMKIEGSRHLHQMRSHRAHRTAACAPRRPGREDLVTVRTAEIEGRWRTEGTVLDERDRTAGAIGETTKRKHGSR